MKDTHPDPSTETTRSWISILLLIHLFCLFLALGANFSPSPMQARLLDVLRPYTQLFNFDFGFTRYYLTHAEVDDVDHRIEILPTGANANDDTSWLILPDGGMRGSDRYRRYQRLASLMAFLADQDEEERVALMAKNIATNFLSNHESEPVQVRCRRHLLQSMDAIDSGTSAQRDAWSAEYFQTPYAANILINNGVVSIVKIDAAGRVARPEIERKP